jgi:hypothetical protein
MSALNEVNQSSIEFAWRPGNIRNVSDARMTPFPPDLIQPGKCIYFNESGNVDVLNEIGSILEESL